MDQVKAGLAGEESFEAVAGEIRIVFFHDVNLLVSPLGDGRGGVEFDGNVGTFAEMFTFRGGGLRGAAVKPGPKYSSMRPVAGTKCASAPGPRFLAR